MSFLVRLAVVVLYAYLLAGIPIVFIALAGRASPMYQVETQRLVRWWSWMALVFVASAVLVYRVLPLITGSSE